MSENTKRILVGLIAIPMLLYIIYIGGIYFQILSLVLMVFCTYELLKMFKDKAEPDLVIILFTCIIAFALFLYFKSLFFISGILIIFYVAYSYLIKKRLSSFMMMILAFVYTAMPFALLCELDKNYYFVYLLMILIWSSDTFAYFGGRLFGKHKLTKISPKKTIEGFVIGFIFTVIAGYIFHLFLPEVFTLADGIIIGILIGVTAPIGDLFESYLKRITGIKDSSNIIPGHGGVLDRFDSLIFSTPFVYLYFYHFRLILL